MLIMFAVGAATLWVMVALALAMAAERLMPGGLRVRWPVAGLAAALSLLLLIGAIPAGLTP